MGMRTVKGSTFIILVDGQQVVVQHVSGKGKRCRVIFPPGVRILDEQQFAVSQNQQKLAGEARSRLA